jgi:hypothetical protein
MNISRITKVLAAAALAIGAAGVAQAAHARTDVYLAVGVPAPVYQDPRPVYVAPPAIYAQPAEVYVRPGYDDWRWRREQLRREEWRREQMRREEWRREQLRREEWRRWRHAHQDRWGDWRD